MCTSVVAAPAQRRQHGAGGGWRPLQGPQDPSRPPKSPLTPIRAVSRWLSRAGHGSGLRVLLLCLPGAALAVAGQWLHPGWAARAAGTSPD